MIPLSRLAAAAAAAFVALRVTAGMAYAMQVGLSFVAAALAAGAVRELWASPPHRLRVFAGDLLTALALSAIMLLAVRAFGRGQPWPLLPALAWPFVDLWRPLRRG